MIHSRTKIVALIALLLFVLSLGVYGGFLYIVSSHKATLLEERLRAGEAEEHVKALKALEETVRTSAQDRKKLEGYILPNTSIIDFVTDIEAKAKGQGVVFTTNNLEEVVINDIFNELEVDATIGGSFDGIMRMLSILETIPLQSTVRSISLSRVDDDGLWTAQVLLRITMYANL